MITYDVIVLWWWASGLMFASSMSHGIRFALLEKQSQVWSKILLSWWWRCNFSNRELVIDRDYVWSSVKLLPSIFHVFSSQDMIDFLVGHDVLVKEEGFWKLFLQSEKPKQLIDLFLHQLHENWWEVFLWCEVISVEHRDGLFVVHTSQDAFTSPVLVIAAWWKSYPQVWTTWFWYALAEQFWLSVIPPQACLCWLTTKEDVSFCSWSQGIWDVRIFSWKKEVAHTSWSVLFTHWWVSWPAIFDATLWLLGRSLEDLSIIIEMVYDGLPKKILHHFWLSQERLTISLWIAWLRPWEEAKVTWWWVALSELTPFLESKKVPWLYFIGEVCDVTWRTWWYNLQWAWSSGYVCAQHIKKLIQP